MNRTIKFRGKRLDNGEWVYGDLLHIAGGCLIYFGSDTETESSDIQSDSKVAVELHKDEIAVVDPDTVGQFTGLLDKNGREIYEGDILHAVGGNDATIGKQFYRSVSFVEGCFCLNVTEYNNVSIPLRNHIINHSLNWDIAGNIHDNPDMLKKK